MSLDLDASGCGRRRAGPARSAGLERRSRQPRRLCRLRANAVPQANVHRAGRLGMVGELVGGCPKLASQRTAR